MSSGGRNDRTIPISGRQYEDRTVAAALYPTDVMMHVLNVDSRFRTNPVASLPSDFTIKLPRPYKNATAVRLASVEIPNTWYEFTAVKGNLSFTVTDNTAPTPGTQTVSIPAGNYTDITTLCLAIQDALNNTFGYTPLAYPPTIGYAVEFDVTTSLITIVQVSSTNFSMSFPHVSTRSFDTGLGYNLGFNSQSLYTGTYTYTADSIPDIVGPNYILMHLDDYDGIETMTFSDTAMTAFAKIIIQVPKNDIIYDNGLNMVSKVIRFPQPQNVSTLRIRLTDAYGNTLHMHNNLSFTLEVTEIVNSRLYETYRQRIPATA
jgi:hypothetical protein